MEKITNVLECKKLNIFDKMIGNIEREDKFNLYNLIVSILRWEISKYRCYLKLQTNSVKYNLISKLKLKICENLNVLQMSKAKVDRTNLNNLVKHINNL